LVGSQKFVEKLMPPPPPPQQKGGNGILSIESWQMGILPSYLPRVSGFFFFLAMYGSKLYYPLRPQTHALTHTCVRLVVFVISITTHILQFGCVYTDRRNGYIDLRKLANAT
jgi:hypothetical protein